MPDDLSPHEAAATAAGTDLTSRAFVGVEHIAYMLLGALFAIIAIVALIHTGIEVVHEIIVWSDVSGIFDVMDQLLFVLMVVEILHTVRVSLRSGTLTPEPFLIVGLIASIRRVLVITLESSQATAGGGWTTDTEALFRASMIELGVLAVLILVMVASIILLRRFRVRVEV